MNKRITELKYKGVTILYTNLSNLKMEEAIAVLEDAMIVVPKYDEQSVLSLLDVTNMRFGGEVMKSFSKAGKTNTSYVLGTAVIGLTSMTRLLAKSVVRVSKRKADFFDEIEDAKEWLYLVSKGEK